MLTVATGTAALTSLKSIYEIAKDIRNSDDPEKLRVAAGHMFDLALAAREQVAALQDERNAAVADLTNLKTEVEKAKAFDAQTENYARVRNGKGAFMYMEKATANPESAAPKFCAQCFLNRRLSILQPNGQPSIHLQKLNCGTCNVTIPGQ